MTDLTVFENPEFGTIRTVELDGEPWLVGKDVAEALGYSNTKDALITHVDDEDKRILQRSEIATFENHIPESALPVKLVSANVPNRGLTIINESGLYSLALSSKLPTARKFRRWVTSEVLPSIRRNGSYGEPSATRARIMEMNARLRQFTAQTQLWTKAGVKPQWQAIALNGFFGPRLPQEAFNGICPAAPMLDATTIASRLGVMSCSGKPHSQAIAALIGKLPLAEDECTIVPYYRNGHAGTSVKYAPSVEDKARAWLELAGWPATIEAEGKAYAVSYRKTRS